jgi:hypothetical protein
MTHLLHISLFHLLTSAIIGREAREEESAAGTTTVCCKCFQIICFKLSLSISKTPQHRGCCLDGSWFAKMDQLLGLVSGKPVDTGHQCRHSFSSSAKFISDSRCKISVFC